MEQLPVQPMYTTTFVSDMFPFNKEHGESRLLRAKKQLRELAFERNTVSTRPAYLSFKR